MSNKNKGISLNKDSNESSSSGKKKGLISSLYKSSNSANKQTKEIVTEKDLLEKFRNGISITPEDVLKLNSYSERIRIRKI
jgi:hypothetical protein